MKMHIFQEIKYYLKRSIIEFHIRSLNIYIFHQSFKPFQDLKMMHISSDFSHDLKDLLRSQKVTFYLKP